jgi:LysR family transcriptional regulator, low CO2-responsive transcriptional regulator
VTLRQLEIFLAVARARSFRRAADTLALSQPALSQQIKGLERELDVDVFDRLGRTIALTQAGRLLEEQSQRIVAMVGSLREALSELRGLQRGVLRLGASTTPGIYLLPGLLARFKIRYPKIEVSLHIGNSREVEDRVRATEVDLGLVGGHVSNAKATCVEASLQDRIVLVVPPEHPWASRRAISSEGLREECLLVREEGSATRRVIDTELDRAGIVPGSRLELGHTEAIKQAVLAGLGVAFVSEYAVRAEVTAGRLKEVRVRGLVIQRHFHAIRHDGRTLSPLERAFLDVLREESQERRPRDLGRGQGPRKTRLG